MGRKTHSVVCFLASVRRPFALLLISEAARFGHETPEGHGAQKPIRSGTKTRLNVAFPFRSAFERSERRPPKRKRNFILRLGPSPSRERCSHSFFFLFRTLANIGCAPWMGPEKSQGQGWPRPEPATGKISPSPRSRALPPPTDNDRVQERRSASKKTFLPIIEIEIKKTKHRTRSPTPTAPSLPPSGTRSGICQLEG